MDERLIAGRYALREPLGGGGWRALDTDLGREVVVRLSAARGLGDATLSHPNVARVFDHGEAEGEAYAVFEYLPGGSLAERLADLDEAAAHDVAQDVSAALAHAHERGVVHGSLAPDSVLFDAEDRAKVAGFGGGGTAGDDVAALGALLTMLAAAAPALAPVAAAAATRQLDAAGVLAGVREVRPAPAFAPAATTAEPATEILAPSAAAAPASPPPPRRSRRALVIALAAVAGLLAAGVAAAFLASPSEPDAEELPTSMTSTASPASTDATTTATEHETEAPPATTQAEQTTSERTTTAKTTTARTTTAPATTAAPPPATTALPATTAPPPAPTATEPPPPTETLPPPTTTETVPTQTASEAPPPPPSDQEVDEAPEG